MDFATMSSTVTSDIVSRHDVIEIVVAMQEQEQTTYARSDYLSRRSTSETKSNDDILCDTNNVNNSSNEVILDGTWRQRIVEWMFGVVDHCSLRRDSVAVAAHYLDLTVERGGVESRQDFQLAAMTALQLAIKLYDSTIVKIDSIIKLGRGMFSEKDVIDMEFKILHTLNWYVHPPTPTCFLRQYLRLLPGAVAPIPRYMITEVTRFISEISVCLYKFVAYPSSAVAYAGMLMAMDRIDTLVLPFWQRQQIHRIFADAFDLHHDSDRITVIVKELHQSLDKNVSLHDLMETIDQQCRDAFGSSGTTKSKSTLTYAGAAYQSITDVATNPAMCSPRDVAEICRP